MATAALSSVTTYDAHPVPANDYSVVKDKYRGAVVEARLNRRI